MSPVALPQSCRPLILLSVALQIIALYLIASRSDTNLWLAIAAFFISGLAANAVTGLAHFGFDYVFPERMPILGPIAKEFHQHHDSPVLDPSTYKENFTKGAYVNLPMCAVVLALNGTSWQGSVAFLVIASLTGLSVWSFFFHQIHSYAHVGSRLPPEVFKARVAQISHLPTKREQRAAFEVLFASVPIHPVIRRLQRCGILLSPERHNIHHIHFDADFSSVNGWSDPVLNLFLGPIARRYKANSRHGLVDGGAVSG